MIQCQNLTKRFGQVLALDQLSFEVENRGVFGLLGPNGSGKTTFIKILLNLIQSYSGEVSIENHSVKSHKARSEFTFYPYDKGMQIFQFYSKMQNIEVNRLLESSLFQSFECEKLLGKKVSQMSKGQLQKIGLICVLASGKKWIVVDEPFSGLDPIAMKDLKEYICEVSKEACVFMSSHLLSEVERLCDKIVLIKDGKRVAYGRIKDLVIGESLEDYFYKKVKGIMT